MEDNEKLGRCPETKAATALGIFGDFLMTHTYIGTVITRCTGQMSAAVGERG